MKAGWDGPANTGRKQRIRRPAGFRGKGCLASLLFSRRSARDILLRLLPAGSQAPRQAAFSEKQEMPGAAGDGKDLEGESRPDGRDDPSAFEVLTCRRESSKGCNRVATRGRDVASKLLRQTRQALLERSSQFRG